MIIFKEKNFGIVQHMAKGATIGGALGTTSLLPILKSGEDRDRRYITFREKKIPLIPIVATAGGSLIGAALGALAYGIESAQKAIDRKKVATSRLMPTIVRDLEKLGHKEGMSFTRDPRKADLLKTKVNIVVYKFSGELRIIVNTVNDKKLDELFKDISKQLSKSRSSVIKEELSGNKFKDIKITTLNEASTNEDAGYVAYIADKFINNGYPVYLVEVG